MPTPVLVESPAAARTIRRIHLVPGGLGQPARLSWRERLARQYGQPLTPALVGRTPSKPAVVPHSRQSLLALAFAASAAPMLWLLHAAAHAIHLL